MENPKTNEIPKTITEKIPEDLLKDIITKAKKKGVQLNEFLQLSIQIANAQNIAQKTLKDMQEQDRVIKSAVNYSKRKMKLHKKEHYIWRFNGKDSFIGFYNPPKPKPQPAKKAEKNNEK